MLLTEVSPLVQQRGDSIEGLLCGVVSAAHSQVAVGEVGEVVGPHAVVRVGGQHGAAVRAAAQRVHPHAVPAVDQRALHTTHASTGPHTTTPPSYCLLQFTL